MSNATEISTENNDQAISTKVFSFNKSHTVRVQVVDGNPWFALRDVCDTLELKVASPERFQLDSAGVTKLVTPTRSGIQELTFINEPNLYRVIFRSNKPEAKQFQDWVFNDVLPEIRKAGAYIYTAAMRPALTKEHWEKVRWTVESLGDSWSLSGYSKNWIYNHMRVTFNVSRFRDVPDDQFGALMLMLASKEESKRQYITFLTEARDWFEKEVLGGGAPWTPAIKSRLSRQLGRQVVLPPKVDWLALARQISVETESA